MAQYVATFAQEAWTYETLCALDKSKGIARVNAFGAAFW